MLFCITLVAAVTCWTMIFIIARYFFIADKAKIKQSSTVRNIKWEISGFQTHITMGILLKKHCPKEVSIFIARQQQFVAQNTANKIHGFKLHCPPEIMDWSKLRSDVKASPLPTLAKNNHSKIKWITCKIRDSVKRKPYEIFDCTTYFAINIKKNVIAQRFEDLSKGVP